MFSSTTMAASSTMPTAKASPAREMMFRVRPVRLQYDEGGQQRDGDGRGDDQGGAESGAGTTTGYPRRDRIPSPMLPPTRPMARLMNTEASKDCTITNPRSRT